MRTTRILLLAALALPLLAPPRTAGAARGAAGIPREVDVCVYGGTAAGVVAAAAAKAEGKSVLLVEPGRHLGGMSSGGLGWTDFGNKAVIGGLSLDFYRRVGKAKGHDDAAWRFEPGVAERVFNDLVKEHGVPVLFEHRLAGAGERGVGATKDAATARVTSIRLEHAPPLPSGAPAPAAAPGREPITVTAKVFLDCTYEGDLMAAAGVGYAVGRESVETYGEPLNGIRAATPKHQFPFPVDPYLEPGDPSSGLLPLIQPGDGGTPGEGDHRVQAYNFRLCLTTDPANRLPIEKPAGYDPARYELLARHVEAMVKNGKGRGLGEFLKLDMVTPTKTDINNNGAVSTDFIGANYEYPDAGWAERSKIWDAHLNYIAGLLYFLGNDPRVPEHLRGQMQNFGRCKDEFTDTGGWPHQMYVREARRMVSEYVITQADCDHRRVAEDSVGMGAYNMDSHNCQRVVQGGVARNEGDVQVGPRGPYPVSYRAVVPKRGQCANLLVPVCFSSSHIAYGSARMEPVFMVLGQSAALAACQAIDEKAAVQEIDVAKLQQKLRAAGQILTLADAKITLPAARPATRLDPAKLPGVVADDATAAFTGDWTAAAALPGFVGAGYRHDGNAAKGERSARFTLPVPRAGEYEVRLSYNPHPNRATNVPVAVSGGEAGPRTFTLDQRKSPSLAGGFAPVGTFRFEAGAEAVVEVSNEGTDGYVIVDAVQLLPAGQGGGK